MRRAGPGQCGRGWAVARIRVKSSHMGSFACLTPHMLALRQREWPRRGRKRQCRVQSSSVRQSLVERERRRHGVRTEAEEEQRAAATVTASATRAAMKRGTPAGIGVSGSPAGCDARGRGEAIGGRPGRPCPGGGNRSPARSAGAFGRE